MARAESQIARSIYIECVCESVKFVFAFVCDAAFVDLSQIMLVVVRNTVLPTIYSTNTNNFEQNRIKIIKNVILQKKKRTQIGKGSGKQKSVGNAFLLICDSFLWYFTVSATRKIN